MRPENKKMADFLKNNGIEGVVPKHLKDGSMKQCWRLWKRGARWSQEQADKLNALGFVDYAGNRLGIYSGNGGMWQVFVRGHNEFLADINE